MYRTLIVLPFFPLWGSTEKVWGGIWDLDYSFNEEEGELVLT